MVRRWSWIVLIGFVLTAVTGKRIQTLSQNHGLGFSSAVRLQARTASAASRRSGSSAPGLDDAELTPDVAAGGELWLLELNKWREESGLSPAVANLSLSRGSERHARYLVNEGPVSVAAFRIYDRTIGSGAHTEDRAARWYTAEGAEAARGGRLTPDVIQCADVAWEGRNQRADIDQLLLAPFHRFSLLAPWGVVAGYGSYGEYPRRVAALALRGPIDESPHGPAVEFPPDNSKIPWNAMVGSEWPNPLSVCPGYEAPVGVPITVQSGERLDLDSYSIYDESDGKELAACAFDARTYRDSDPVQRRRGRELLAAYGAAVLIPRRPLRAGDHYRVDIDARQGHFAWSFGVGQSPPPSAHPITVRSASAAPTQKRSEGLSSR